MRNLKLVLAYDGTEFSGWQVQPGRPTVQGVLEERLSRMLQEPVRLAGAGREVGGEHGFPDYGIGVPAEGLRAGGNSQEAAELERLAAQVTATQDPGNARAEVLDLLAGFHRRDKAGEMAPFFRSLTPFALAGEPLKTIPFLVIDDPALLTTQHRSSAEPLVIYTTDLGPEVKELLPQVCILDSQEHTDAPPYIWWNSPKDLTSSKLMHVSTQPFYLRRYARRVAEIWQREYGRRPIVHAATAMSLNGRPPQPMVDPSADLATVSVAWLRHNSWIKNLETPRIPAAAIAANPGFNSR